MSVDDRALSRREHDEMRDLVLAGTHSIRPAGASRGRFAAAGVALLLVGGLLGGGLSWALWERDSPAVVPAIPAPRTAVWSGWVAFAAGKRDADIYLVKEGTSPVRILGSDTDTVDQVCPAFSPDGRRIVSGQATDDRSGAVAAAVAITELTADGEPSRTTTVGVDGVTRAPCPIWSADGRWLAFGVDTDGTGVSEVRVVDTATSETRRLAGLAATGLEWSPTGSELFIAHNVISVYSTATGQTRRVDGTLGATALAVSPDGQSLIVQHDISGRPSGPVDLLWMRPDGSDQRTLVSDYRLAFGVGPVWSPDGHRVALQRLCDTYVDTSGKERACVDEHEVVVVTVNQRDLLGPAGTQTVIPPPQTTLSGQPRQWFPYSVTWSPDSLTLLYVAWASPGDGVLAVPVDSPTTPVILEDSLGVAGHNGEPWNTKQSWNRQP